MDLDIEELIARYGTPLYLYNADIVRERARALKESITYPKTKLLYAMKANSCPGIMRALIDEGYGIDAVSPGEVILAQRLGVPSEDILFTENNMTEGEMHHAMAEGVLINAGSLHRLERMGRSGAGKACIRINPDIGDGEHAHVLTAGPLTKFGIHHSQMNEVIAIEEETGIKVVGVHMHIGSNILDTDTFLGAMQVILSVAKELPNLEFIDFGGGIGVPYKEGETPLDLGVIGKQASDVMTTFCAEYGRELELRLEPGRYLVAECGTLYTSVTSVKTNPAYDGEEPRTFVGCDSGFNHLLRPTLYGSYHPITNVTRPVAEKVVVDVVGNICESGDVFARARAVQDPRVGDILAIGYAGAYGMAMASTYNLRPLPPELMLENGNISIIRKRRTINDLLDDWIWPEPDDEEENEE